MSKLLQDLKYGTRILLKQTGFTLVGNVDGLIVEGQEPPEGGHLSQTEQAEIQSVTPGLFRLSCATGAGPRFSIHCHSGVARARIDICVLHAGTARNESRSAGCASLRIRPLIHAEFARIQL